MHNPKILVTSVAGRTGSAAVRQLLDRGFPVQAFVRRRDARAARLEKAGAELFVGDLFDFRDLCTALIGVQRAYYCSPFTPNFLHGAMLFAIARRGSQVGSSGADESMEFLFEPSVRCQSEHWIANQLYRWMPSVDVIHLNPGIFAFEYLLGLPAIVHFGRLLAPFGEGRNAPPKRRHCPRRRWRLNQSGCSHR
ncbi:MAG: NAD(P)H-binding protein [Pseudanabaenales cyanobacterium]|nr:NAD(P)H-binding protein [Pseudanabaenales cyanobacterium]